MKANCSRKKYDYIFRIIRDNNEKKEKEMKKTERRNICKQERKRQLRIIENRAKDIYYKLTKKKIFSNMTRNRNRANFGKQSTSFISKKIKSVLF